jgi:hypothetical protein
VTIAVGEQEGVAGFEFNFLRKALSRRRAASAKIRRLKEWSGRCDRRLPRVHSRSTKRVMGLG